MSLKKRLDLALKELRLSGRSFEKEVGLANGSYSSIRDRVGADKLNKILTRFPQISADWLISGVGEMMRKNEDGSDFNSYGSIFARKRGTITHIALSRDEMKTILFQLAGTLSDHQQDISRLIAELEHNGKRSDRLLDLIQQGLVREEMENPGQQQNPATLNGDSLRAD
jgi:hypothetical protein